MSETNEQAAGEKPGEKKSTDEKLRNLLMQAAVVKLVKAGVDAGASEGAAEGYGDIVTKLREELERAEGELLRSPKSDLVMGEVMVLNRLVAFFNGASAHFERQSRERFADVREYLERLGVPKDFSDTLRPYKRS